VDLLGTVAFAARVEVGRAPAGMNVKAVTKRVGDPIGTWEEVFA